MEEKMKKPFYKRWYVWALAVVIIIGAASGGEDQPVSNEPVEDPQTEVNTEPVSNEVVVKEVEQESNQEEEEETVQAVAEKVEPEQEVKEESVPREYSAALKKAEIYAETMHMSKAGVYDQLTSEYGEGFPAEAAQYAIDNIEWDWKESALKKAQLYAESMSMSDSAIYEQLISEYGEKFTPAEAQYAIDNLE